MPTPLERAQAEGERAQAEGDRPSDVATLLLRAGAIDLGAWSPESHVFFPDAARSRAVFMLWVGDQLAAADRPKMRMPAEVWTHMVMPWAVTRV